ncbi:unnamed protein product, partial [Ectocarpus sp. 8 AP-2014]
RAGAGSGGEADGAGKVVVVLLPTHRSYLDFVLVSLFCASMRSFPGLSWLRVPKVAAADGPFGKEGTPLRWLMGKLGAFFIRRGHNSEPHSDLRRRLEALQERGLETLEVFVEGTRSRDRRFLAPKTGLIRALQVGTCVTLLCCTCS